jgi:hypothetical protein
VSPAPNLDDWLGDAALRVQHRRESSAPADALWAAARAIRLCDTARLGRLVKWRIPGVERDMTFDALFRESPFVVLAEGEWSLVSGLVGRIWTLRRDYPQLTTPQEFCEWSQRGTARVAFAHWVEPATEGRAVLASEARVQALGAQGRVGVAAVRPVVRAFHSLVGTEGISAAVRRAERGL